jgi:hypothetical protein
MLTKLRSPYDAYANTLISRRMIVPGKLVAETLDIARDDGALIQRKARELFDEPLSKVSTRPS